MRHSRCAGIHLLVWLIVVAWLGADSAPALASSKARKIDAVVQTFHKLQQFNGAVLVAQGGKVLYKKGVGLANFEWNVANTPDTKFRLASLSKQFTAALVLKLVEQGKIDLNSTISKYLPEYRQDTATKVTIHHLLSHTSGIPNYTSPSFFEKFSRDPYTVAQFIKQFASGDLEFTPGSAFRYSNSGYFILGAIIEKTAGKSYEEALHELIFRPLGMKNSGYDHHETILAKRAAGYERNANAMINSSYLDMSIPYAAGSLYSTVEDLFLWDQALYGNDILTESSKARMFKPNLEDTGYGIGVYTLALGPDGALKVPAMSHNGGINGFSTRLLRFVQDKHLIVILDNTSQGRYVTQLSLAIANILYDQPYRAPKPSITTVLRQTLANASGTVAVAQYHQIKNSLFGMYDFNEVDLINLGYDLMSAPNRLDDAIAIFELAAEVHDSANAHDSLGEAYLKRGDRALAIASYKRSLALDPQNIGAVQVLKSLEVPATPAAAAPKGQSHRH